MAPTHFPSHIEYTILTFLTLILLAHSIPAVTLLPYDHSAYRLIHKSLSLPLHPDTTNPCHSPGISCEPRPSLNNASLVLRITRIAFNSHGLNGRLSPAIGQLSELEHLSLPDNRLVGHIPPQIVDCRNLLVLNLSDNGLSGRIPPALSSLARLKVLDLSSNQFVGSLKFLKHFPNLEKLNLADNMFAGKVPVSLKSFRNLRFIDISGNSLLDGPIPLINNQDLSEEKVEIIPRRYVFAESSRNRSASALASTNRSASALAPSAAAAPAPSPMVGPASHHLRRNRKRIIGWILGFLAGVVGGILSGVGFSLIFKLVMLVIKGPNKDMALKIFSPMIKKPEDLAFLEKEDGLASLTVIGRGGCGEVYKAVLLGSNGKEIAIKKIIQPPKDADELTEEDSKLLTKKMRQIKSEIKTVGQIRHRNLLSLLAHMPRPDCHYLVYEYMKNGSLQDWFQDLAQGRRELDWLARYKIALGVVAGLEYLHINHTPRIIHRDLKPANILLDDEMEARIADFGLAKAVPEAHTHCSTSNIAGTVGYIAPEYYQTSKFTDKCDIYSFGVVLGVLVTGKLPSDQFFQATDEMSLVKWMRNVMTSEDPKRAIDPKLLGNGYEEQMMLVLKIACFCTLDNAKERPNSKDARCMLSQIKH